MVNIVQADWCSGGGSCHQHSSRQKTADLLTTSSQQPQRFWNRSRGKKLPLARIYESTNSTKFSSYIMCQISRWIDGYLKLSGKRTCRLPYAVLASNPFHQSLIPVQTLLWTNIGLHDWGESTLASPVLSAQLTCFARNKSFFVAGASVKMPLLLCAISACHTKDLRQLLGCWLPRGSNQRVWVQLLALHPSTHHFEIS